MALRRAAGTDGLKPNEGPNDGPNEEPNDGQSPRWPSIQPDLDYLEHLQQEGIRIIQQIGSAQARLRAMRGSGEGDRRLARAVAGRRGALEELHFEARIMRLSPEELGKEVSTAIRRAQEDAERQTQEIMGEVYEMTESLPAPPDSAFVAGRVRQIVDSLPPLPEPPNR
jgi:hypothetical protein